MLISLAENGNLLLGTMPETLGILIFGIVLILVAVGLRWFLGQEEVQIAEDSVKHLAKKAGDTRKKEIIEEAIKIREE